MNNPTQSHIKGRISHSHRNLLGVIWNIHQGLRNGTKAPVLKNYLEFIWDTKLREHFLNEEILISSNIKKNHPITDGFFNYHGLFRQKVKEILESQNNDIKENLENLCILLIEIVRYEERSLKPYLKQFISAEVLDEHEEENEIENQGFFPRFWNN